MSRISGYVREVLEVAGLPSDCEQAEELQSHLVDMVAEHKRQGLTDDQAEDRALTEFGTPQVIGLRLREVTPLRLGRRDWAIIALGATAAGTVGVLDLFHYPHSGWAGLFGFDWFGLVPLLGILVAAMVRRPVLGSLAPAAGILAARILVLQVLGNNLPSPDRWWSFLYSRMFPFHALGTVTWDLMDLFEYVSLTVISVTVGLLVARLRRLPSSQVYEMHLTAGLAHLTPFLVMLGLRWGAVGALYATVLWWRHTDRSPFVSRHAFQAAVVTVGAVISQVLTYQFSVYSLRAVPGSTLPFVLALAVMVARRIFGIMALWGAISAFSGHDFRYPFAGFLFGGGKRRRLRHV